MITTLSNEHQTNQEDLFNYSYGRYFSNGVLVLTSIVFIAGLFLLSKGINEHSLLVLPGLFMATLGISSYFPIELFQINNRTREYRVSFKIGPYLKGDWKKIGDVKYLSIINTHKKIQLNYDDDYNAQKHDIIKECRLRIYKKAGYTIDVDDYNTKESAIVIGKIIAKGLGLKLLDATQRPPVFIDIELLTIGGNIV